ncbi:hypothetical protein QJS66_19880 [Kocuria rhizophila]|nr:hypothetical protein QJS66_19880 [Kocuria rhizophila]
MALARRVPRRAGGASAAGPSPADGGPAARRRRRARVCPPPARSGGPGPRRRAPSVPAGRTGRAGTPAPVVSLDHLTKTLQELIDESIFISTEYQAVLAEPSQGADWDVDFSAPSFTLRTPPRRSPLRRAAGHRVRRPRGRSCGAGRSWATSTRRWSPPRCRPSRPGSATRSRS